MALKKSGLARRLAITGVSLFSLLIVCSVSTYLLPQFGWRVDGLRSGSMEPALMTGDLIVTRPVLPSEIRAGDIIMFRAPPGTADGIISHRVIAIQESSPVSFQTGGDNNAAPDPFLVPAGDVIGVFASRIPFLGHLVIPLKTFPGLLLSLVAPGFGLIYICLKSIRNELVAQREMGSGDV